MAEDDALQVERSLEIAAARSPDLTPMVYARLFAREPAQLEMFCLDSDGSVRGNMLFHALRVLLDLLGERSFGPSFLAAEATTHAGLGVRPEVFASLYEDIRDVVRDLCGSDWSREMGLAWNALIAEIKAVTSAGQGAGALAHAP